MSWLHLFWPPQGKHGNSKGFPLLGRPCIAVQLGEQETPQSLRLVFCGPLTESSGFDARVISGKRTKRSRLLSLDQSGGV